MKQFFFVLASVLVLAASGCAGRVNVDPEASGERAALRQADIEFAKAAGAKDVDRLVSFYAADAAMFPPNAAIVTGKEAIRKLWSQTVALPAYSLSWQASKVEVSRAGDLGYLLGTYEETMNDPEGKPVTERGKYVAVWRKQASADWKVVADIWNTDQPPPAAPRP